MKAIIKGNKLKLNSSDKKVSSESEADKHMTAMFGGKFKKDTAKGMTIYVSVDSKDLLGTYDPKTGIVSVI